MIFINFKTYEQGTGAKAVELAGVCKQVERVFGVRVIPVVQAVDVFRVAHETEMDWVWCQHCDDVEYGSNTGSILAEGVKQAGARGVLLNHAERKFRVGGDLDGERLGRVVKRCRDVGLGVGICADSIEELEKVLELGPDWVAYEPVELIGSAEGSVISEKSDVVKRAVEICEKVGVDLVIGAGVKSGVDVRIGVELGAVGVLVASAVLKSDDPDEVLRDLVKGME